MIDAPTILHRLATQERLLTEALHRMVVVNESKLPAHLETVIDIIGQLNQDEATRLRTVSPIEQQIRDTMAVIGDLFQGTLVLKGVIEQAHKEGRPLEPILKQFELTE